MRYHLSMNEEELQNLREIFKSYPSIKVVYLFGSKALDNEGPLSDYDFAVYFDGKDTKRMFDLKLELLDRLSRFLRTDKIDIVILNTTEGPELKYQIIKEGKVIYEEEPYRILIEPKILNEYFDFHYMLSKYGLTKA
jgi:predicted nucleotidyltransferase